MLQYTKTLKLRCDTKIAKGLRGIYFTPKWCKSANLKLGWKCSYTIVTQIFFIKSTSHVFPIAPFKILY